MKKRNILSLCVIVMITSTLCGCSFNIKEKFKDTFDSQENISSSNVGMQKDKYVIDSSLLGVENIEIDLPEGFTAIGDTNDTTNSYVSLYHSDLEAKQDDYVLTYSIATSIEKDREETLHVYQDMYSNFMASEIEKTKINDIDCSYYTITYMLSGETLTDYIFQFNKDDTLVLAKLGTTFYPLDITIEEAADILYKNIK